MALRLLYFLRGLSACLPGLMILPLFLGAGSVHTSGLRLYASLCARSTYCCGARHPWPSCAFSFSTASLKSELHTDRCAHESNEHFCPFHQMCQPQWVRRYAPRQLKERPKAKTVVVIAAAQVTGPACGWYISTASAQASEIIVVNALPGLLS